MSNNNGVLVLVVDASLRPGIDRIAAAAGVRVVHSDEPSSRKAWTSASAVVLDVAAALRCTELGLPRRDRVVVIGPEQPTPEHWKVAISVGAQRVLSLPVDEAALVSELSEAAEAVKDGDRRGAVVAVIGGCGGAGATVFATALAHAAPRALLVDVDPWSGGIDLTLGSERNPGLRWPDLALGGGRIAYSALAAALPSRHGVAVLSSGQTGREIDAAALAAVIDGGCRGGATIVCDLPRRATSAVGTVLDAADLVVLVTPADTRSSAAAAAMAQWLAEINPNVGLVVRGPAPGGLRSTDVARITGMPLLAAMRPQPGLAAELEHDGMRPRRRSPLTSGARRVLEVLHRQPGTADEQLAA
ncbi:septum site-determining protein Ssd [Mycolicibacterium sp.]|uniref:septum site-determining protein Ssd n=1 Tax=Mycolicibacterium sp. TaxID=2320850 RepID=UPI001A2FB0ED|nr:septum site-determining protein Ssd [Mycolicibacterium sp.]MBJ7339532.1 CpaE-like family protein [Mycolicibacterium sp.]